MKAHQFTMQAYDRMLTVTILVLSLLGISGSFSTSYAAEETSSQSSTTASKAASMESCCEAGNTTPPTKLVKEIPKGQLKNPYANDLAKVAKEGHQQFLNAGCNGCHGGTGGGGMCPPLNQGVWFFGSSGDTLFRLITLGSQGLEKEGFKRKASGAVQGPMPPMGSAIPTSDDLWKIISWIKSINPAATPVPAFPKAYSQ